MARYFDLQSTVLVVVGHGILPEEEDRPIAYELKRAVNARTGGSQERAAVVVTDACLMNQELGVRDDHGGALLGAARPRVHGPLELVGDGSILLLREDAMPHHHEHRRLEVEVPRHLSEQFCDLAKGVGVGASEELEG